MCVCVPYSMMVFLYNCAIHAYYTHTHTHTHTHKHTHTHTHTHTHMYIHKNNTIFDDGVDKVSHNKSADHELAGVRAVESPREVLRGGD